MTGSKWQNSDEACEKMAQLTPVHKTSHPSVRCRKCGDSRAATFVLALTHQSASAANV